MRYAWIAALLLSFGLAAGWANKSSTTATLPPPPATSSFKFPPPRTDKNDPVAEAVFSVVCQQGPAVQAQTWTNTTGMTLLVDCVWSNLAAGSSTTQADMFLAVRRGDGSWMTSHNWDHYQQPSAPVMQHLDCNPPYQILPGEKLTMYFYAWGGHPEWIAQFDVVMRCRYR